MEVVGLEDEWLYWADRDQAVIVRVDKMSDTRRQAVLSRHGVQWMTQVSTTVIRVNSIDLKCDWSEDIHIFFEKILINVEICLQAYF